MRQRRALMPALLSAAAGAACLALATPAWAATPLHQPSVKPGDPYGANGTVKIDGAPYAEANNNEPHVPCEFRVEFFNFDKGERADIILTAQPPSGNGFEVARRNDVLVSDDAASGGSVHRDADAYVQFSADDLDLSKAEPHEKQGYHLKLTIDRKNHPDKTEKHKVFWLEPCAATPSPGTTDEAGRVDGTDAGAGTDTAGGDTAAGGTGGGGTGGGEGGSLPITGTAVGGIVALGVGLIGGGAALMFARRRRNVTFTS